MASSRSSLIRRQKLLDRVQHTRDAKIFLVATEGAATEKVYFEDFNPRSDGRAPFEAAPVQVKVLPPLDHHSSPVAVQKRLREFVALYALDPRDELWLVLDVDKWPERTLAKILGARRFRPQIAISNPCFEVWLCFHLNGCSDEEIADASQNKGIGQSPGQNLKRLLREKLGSYNEASPDLEPFRPHRQAAIQRAESSAEGVVSADHPWPAPPGTRVGRLVKNILNSLER